MGILDKIKGKKGEKASKQEDVLGMVKEDTGKKAAPKPLKENTGTAHRVLSAYHLSEKSNAIAQNGRYVFKVRKAANKIEIRKAVESVYDVHVVAVNIVNVTGKSRRYGRKTGRTSDWKKAYVTLKSGESISGLAEGT